MDERSDRAAEGKAGEKASEGAEDDRPAWRRRVMRGGRWVEPHKGTPPAKDDPAAFTVTSVKARRAEIEEFRAVCAELGVKPNRAHRAMMRRAAGYLEADPDEIETLRSLQREVHAIGSNVNQIARVANQTGHADVEGLRSQMKGELGPALLRLTHHLQRILNAARRRQDGRERLARDVAILDREDPSGTGKHGAVARQRVPEKEKKGTSEESPDLGGGPSTDAPEAAEAANPSRFKLRKPPYPYVHPNKQR